MKIKDALLILATDPDYANYNFQLGRCYEEEKQWAAAVSFYLRAAEQSGETLLAYESLLRIYICFKTLGNRMGIGEGLLLRAVSIMPERPEAYFLLTQHYEIQKQWAHSYTYSCIGENLHLYRFKELNMSVGYYGEEAFVYQKAVAGWWIGLFTQSINLFTSLEKKTLPDYIHNSVKSNLGVITQTFMNSGKYGDNLEFPYYLNKDVNKYYPSLYHRYKFKFPRLETITENYSQCYQDMFVLSATHGLRGGRYVEIGCGVPKYNNNTYLLETKFGWTGIAIDINPRITKLQERDRKSRVINADATTINYKKELEDFGNIIEYLQIDCEPASTSYEILKRIPFEWYKFAVITFEHESYIDDNKNIKQLSRDYLTSFGYIMLVGDIAMDEFTTFEDWWVHPDLVDADIIKQMTRHSNDITPVTKYILTT